MARVVQDGDGDRGATVAILTAKQRATLECLAAGFTYGHLGTLRALERRGFVTIHFSGGVNQRSGRWHRSLDVAKITDKGREALRENES